MQVSVVLAPFCHFQHNFVCFESTNPGQSGARAVILVASGGAVSGGIPVDSGGFRWVPVGSGGFRWVPVGWGFHLKLSQKGYFSGGNGLPGLGPGNPFSPENHQIWLVFRWECFSKLFCVGKCYLTAKSRHGFRWLGFKGLWTWPRPT